MGNFWLALGLTVFAGMATSIGSAIAFFAHRTNYRFLSVATGFSAGVMLYVSFVEIFIKGTDAMVAAYGNYWGHWVNVASFFGGILLIGIIDNLIPSAENPHEMHTEQEIAPLHDISAPLPDFAAVAADPAHAPVGAHDHRVHHAKLMRMGLFTALARLGSDLLARHLLESPRVEKLITSYSGPATPEVGRVGWSDDTVWLDAVKTNAREGHRATNPGTIGAAGVTLALQILGGDIPDANVLTVNPVIMANDNEDGLAMINAAQNPDLSPTWPVGLQIPGWTTYTNEELIACAGLDG